MMWFCFRAVDVVLFSCGCGSQRFIGVFVAVAVFMAIEFGVFFLTSDNGLGILLLLSFCSVVAAIR